MAAKGRGLEDLGTSNCGKQDKNEREELVHVPIWLCPVPDWRQLLCLLIKLLSNSNLGEDSWSCV